MAGAHQACRLGTWWARLLSRRSRIPAPPAPCSLMRWALAGIIQLSFLATRPTPTTLLLPHLPLVILRLTLSLSPPAGPQTGPCRHLRRV